MLCRLKRWFPVWEFYKSTFLGEPIKYHWTRFLYCEETDEAKELRDWTHAPYWEYLNKDEVKILKRKMKKNGNHYELTKTSKEYE